MYRVAALVLVICAVVVLAAIFVVLNTPPLGAPPAQP
jgi:hypothetical protein